MDTNLEDFLNVIFDAFYYGYFGIGENYKLVFQEWDISPGKTMEIWAMFSPKEGQDTLWELSITIQSKCVMKESVKNLSSLLNTHLFNKFSCAARMEPGIGDTMLAKQNAKQKFFLMNEKIYLRVDLPPKQSAVPTTSNFSATYPAGFRKTAPTTPTSDISINIPFDKDKVLAGLSYGKPTSITLPSCCIPLRVDEGWFGRGEYISGSST